MAGNFFCACDKLIVSNIFMNVTTNVRQVLDPITAFNCWLQLILHFQQNLEMAQVFLEKQLRGMIVTEGNNTKVHNKIWNLSIAYLQMLERLYLTRIS